MLVQFDLGHKIQCQYSLLHHILITLCANGIYLITHIIKYQCIDKIAFSLREVMREVEIDNPRCSSFQLRAGGNRCQRHFCIRIDIRAIQSQREFIHSVRGITHRTNKQILTYFYLHSCHGCLIRYILIRKITSGACHFDAGYRILNQFIESCERNQLGRSEIKVPFQIKVIMIRRFQIGVTLTVEVHADITVRRYFLCLRKRICFTSSQTKRVFIIQIVFEIQAGQEIIFLDGIVSFRASTIHIIIHFNIHLVIFQSQIHNPTGSKLVGSFGISGMNILFYCIFI